MAIQITSTTLLEVKITDSQVFGDAQGFFFESYNANEFATHLAPGYEFVQDNHSRSLRNVLRGLHYQIEHPQGACAREPGRSIRCGCRYAQKFSEFWKAG